MSYPVKAIEAFVEQSRRLEATSKLDCVADDSLLEHVLRPAALQQAHEKRAGDRCKSGIVSPWVFLITTLAIYLARLHNFLGSTSLYLEYHPTSLATNGSTIGPCTHCTG